MGNILKMEKQQQIQGLLALNWSYRAIERETGVRRETIAKYDPRKADKVPTDDSSKPANCPPTSRSTAVDMLPFWFTLFKSTEAVLETLPLVSQSP